MKRLAFLLSLLAAAALRVTAVEPTADIHTNFTFALPLAKRTFPEPLPAGAQPGFKIRGTKGWAWTPDQYLAEIPFIAKYKMNFLMNCYLSMFDIEHYAKWNDPDANRWWEDLPSAKLCHDKFHLVKYLNAAVDMVRRKETKTQNTI